MGDAFPKVTQVTLTGQPASARPTITDLETQQAGELGSTQAGPPQPVAPDANRAWMELGWVLGHGLPSSLRRARTASLAIRAVRG